jgi:hypothetical protein
MPVFEYSAVEENETSKIVAANIGKGKNIASQKM